MKKKLTLIPAIALSAMFLSTGNSQARGENEIIRLVHSIQAIANEVKNEFQTHYTRSSAYRHLLTDVNDVIVKANHIDSLAHDPRTSYRHIKADLSEIDKLVHHIHDLVDDIEKGRYRGYVEGGLGHVHSKVRSLNDAIHRMDDALVAYSSPAPGCPTNTRGGGYTSRDNDWTRIMGPLFGGLMNIAPVQGSHGHDHSH